VCILVHAECLTRQPNNIQKFFIFAILHTYIKEHDHPKGRTDKVLKFKEKLANLLSLPKEIALDLPVVTATGQGELIIENYKNLIEFTDKTIRIRTRDGTITIDGNRLILKQITSENLLIAGRISGITYD